MTDSSSPITPDQIRSALGDDAARLVDTYFNSGTYTGGLFERFAGGGDRVGHADLIDADDIVAVSMLSVRIPGAASLCILEDDAPAITAHFSEIPVDIDLWEAGPELIASDSPAAKLWSLLEGFPGMGWVSAGKLMARKRPRLIPVYDRVVRSALERDGKDGWWEPLRQVLADNPPIIEDLKRIRDESGIGDDISLLRVLDVAIWMRKEDRPGEVPPADPDDEA